jgi:hypothetical protein
VTKRSRNKNKPQKQNVSVPQEPITPDSAPDVVRSPGLRKWLIVGGALASVIIGAALIFLTRPAAESGSTNSTQGAYQIGNVEYCSSVSQFAEALGFAGGGAIDTRANFVKGVALRELDYQGTITRSYEHPSWSKAGYLGSYQRDQVGNIYLIPMPFISIYDNPPAKANTVYRIDTVTGAMAPLVNLPALGPPTAENVYGLMDIAYDCDTRSLYVSSVSGSTFEDPFGCIFRVDPYTKAVKSTLEGIDAFGIGVFNTAQGKRLFFGLAREPEIYSVGLDENGDFDTSDIRPEISLRDLGFHGDERARSITFQGQEQLLVKTLQFDFNLVAPTETRPTILEYAYQPEQDDWQLVASQLTNG